MNKNSLFENILAKSLIISFGLTFFGIIGLIFPVYKSPVTTGPYQQIIGSTLGYLATKYVWFFVAYDVLGLLAYKYFSKTKNNQ
jgi:hypothetical protein